MSKRLTAIVMSAVCLPLASLAVVSAAPAQAVSENPCAGVYPPSSPYLLRRSPSYVKVAKGSQVELGTRLVRGPLQCDNENIGWWAHGTSEPQNVYHLSRTATTHSVNGAGGGLDFEAYTVNSDFRFFTNFVLDGVERAQSPGGLIQVG